MKRPDALKLLIEEVKELEEHPRNLKIRNAWSSIDMNALPQGHGIPHLSKEVETIPFTVELEADMWAKLLGFSVEKFFKDAYCFLENTLRMMIYRFKVFQDFTPIDLTIPMWYGVILESSLFGAQPIFKEDQSPWIAREPLIKDYSDLKYFSIPDFYKSGIMPVVHKMYENLQELAGNDFRIAYPRWIRGPFGVAIHLRGFENILADFYLNPQFVHNLMRILTDANKEWVKEKARFVGLPIIPAILANDEINCPTLSPKQYEEFILPYEKEICEFHGGIRYWHSCGDTTKLIPSIRKIPKLDIFHIGPWTDMSKAREGMSSGTAFQKCLMPTDEIYSATPQQMRARLREIRRVLDGSVYTVRADGFQVVKGLEKDLAKIKKWYEIAREELCNKDAG